MPLFDLLDRESDELIKDIRACLAAKNEALDDVGIRALLKRAAAFCFALEQVVYPTAFAVGVDVDSDVVHEHATLKERIAAALLEGDGIRKRASSVYRRLKNLVALLRQSLYPSLYAATSTLRRTVAAEGLLRCLDANPERAAMFHARRSVARAFQAADAKRLLPAHLKLECLPVLHNVIQLAKIPAAA